MIVHWHELADAVVYDISWISLDVEGGVQERYVKMGGSGGKEEITLWFTEELTPHDVYHHGVKELYVSRKTDYQTMTIADVAAYGRALFLDGRIQLAEGDEALYHEPLVHSGMVLNTMPSSGGQGKRILIMGGGDGGAAREALRWHGVTRVICVDIDGVVVDECRKHLPNISQGAWEDPRCELIIGDALKYIAESDEEFDVIISDITDPVEGSAVLTLFTIEHFARVKHRLAPGGVLVVQGGALSLIESPIFPRVCQTLKEVFTTVHPAHVFPPTFGSPSGLIVAMDGDFSLPTYEDIDQIFSDNLNSQLRILDGRGVHGMFAVAKNIILAIGGSKPITTAEVEATLSKS